MFSRLQGRVPGHTTVVAYLTLFMVLGGGAYAAHKVGSGDIKKNAVRSKHIKNGQVGAADLASSAKPRRIAFIKPTTDSTRRPLFTIDGAQVLAYCGPDEGGQPVAYLDVRNVGTPAINFHSSNHQYIFSPAFADDGPVLYEDTLVGAGTTHREDPVVLARSATLNAAGHGNGQGTAVVRTPHAVITVVASAKVSNGNGLCDIAGIVTQA